MSWLIIDEKNYYKDTEVNYINLDYLSGIDITSDDKLVFFCDGREIFFDPPDHVKTPEELRDVARNILNLSLSKDHSAVYLIGTIIDTYVEKRKKE